MSANVSCQSQRLWMVSQYNEFSDRQKVLLSQGKFYVLVAGFSRSNRWAELVKDNREKALFGLTQGDHIPISITNTIVGFIQYDGTSKLEREYNNDRMVRQLLKQENESFDYNGMAVLPKSAVCERKKRDKLLLNGFFRESCAIWGVNRSTQKRIPPSIGGIIASFLFMVMETDTNNHCLDISLKKCGFFSKIAVRESSILVLPTLTGRAMVDKDLQGLKKVDAFLRGRVGVVVQYKKNILSDFKAWTITLKEAYPSLVFEAQIIYLAKGLFARQIVVAAADNHDFLQPDGERFSINFAQKEMKIPLKQQIEELKFIAKWPDNMTGANEFVKILETYSIASNTIDECEDCMFLATTLDDSNTISKKDLALCESYLRQACWDAGDKDFPLELRQWLIKNHMTYDLALEWCRYEVKTNTVTIKLKKYYW